MSILSGFAKGFLSLVDSQNFGINPKDLSDTVSPVVSIEDLYLLQKQVGVLGIVAVPAAGLNLAITVPVGEVWRVHLGGVFMINGVGVTNTYTPVAEVKGGGGIAVPLGPGVAGPASATTLAPMTCAPFWLNAGDSLGAYGASLVGVPTVSVAFMVSKLRG